MILLKTNVYTSKRNRGIKMALQAAIEKTIQTIIADGFDPETNRFYVERIHAMEGDQCAYTINAITGEKTTNQNFVSVMPSLIAHYEMNEIAYGHWAGE
jgi:tryptophanyl-tRNA synthetase